MQLPDTTVRAIALQAMELNMIEAGFEQTLRTCKEHQEKLGKGALILRMDPEQQGIPTYWKPWQEVPDPRVKQMAAMADVGKGVITVVLVYPARVAAYVLNLNISMDWRKLTQRPFAIMEEFCQEEGRTDPLDERASTPAMRPEDLEEDDFFS